MAVSHLDGSPYGTRSNPSIGGVDLEDVLYMGGGMLVGQVASDFATPIVSNAIPGEMVKAGAAKNALHGALVIAGGYLAKELFGQIGQASAGRQMLRGAATLGLLQIVTAPFPQVTFGVTYPAGWQGYFPQVNPPAAMNPALAPVNGELTPPQAALVTSPVTAYNSLNL